MENSRFAVDVTVDEAVLHDVYLPHFKRVIDQDVAAVMAAYNSVNDVVRQITALPTTVLRDLWDWDGITVSDFIWGMRDGAQALNADITEEPFQQRALHLRDQIAPVRRRGYWSTLPASASAAQLHRTPGARMHPPADVMADHGSRVCLCSGGPGHGPAQERAGGRWTGPPARSRFRRDDRCDRPTGDSPQHGRSRVIRRTPSVDRDATRWCALASQHADMLHVESDDVSEACSAATAADVAIVVVGYDAL